MSFFTVSTSEENVRDGGNSSYINKSGIYECIIKDVIVEQTPKGSQYLNLWIECNGQAQPIFQAMRITNNDGSPNFGQKLFTKLCVIAGAADGAEISDPVSKTLPMGKGGSDVECMVLTEFEDIPVFIRIQMSYTLYNGKIQESKIVRNFFRYTDKATASEIVNDAETKGEQYAIEEATADKTEYKDGLTAEDVDNWKKNRSKGNTEETKSNTGVSFGQKRVFGKK